MYTHALGYLSEELAGTIYFRAERAKQYPADGRSAVAVDLMRRLSTEIEALYGSRTEERIDAALNTLEARELDPDPFNQVVDEFWRGIGFDYFPESADELANDVAAMLESLAASDEEEPSTIDNIEGTPAGNFLNRHREILASFPDDRRMILALVRLAALSITVKWIASGLADTVEAEIGRLIECERSRNPAFLAMRVIVQLYAKLDNMEPGALAMQLRDGLDTRLLTEKEIPGSIKRDAIECGFLDPNCDAA